jgi:D-cysteine desulfhydrase
VKRDDLTGFELGGNKVRKLEFSLARAIDEGADAVLTCGGYDSNHCRATAFFARRLGLEPHLLLRTPDGRPPSHRGGNTLLDSIAGAAITWVTPDEYRSGAAMLRAHRERVERSGRRVFAIPEGASDPLGALGFAAAAEELAAQEREIGVSFATIVHAVGSGGTSAGLAAGRDALDRPWRILGVPVCDDGAYFRTKVSSIREGLAREFGLPHPGAKSEHDLFLDGAVGRGYGLSTPEELRGYGALARSEGLLLDPCYTGKAFRGLEHAVSAGTIRPGERVLFWHTGGAFANFTQAEEWRAALS